MTKSKILIRQSVEQDIFILQQIEKDAMECFMTIPGYEFLSTFPILTTDDHRQFIASGTSFLAEYHGEIAGFCLMGKFAFSVHIFEISVKRLYQKQGIGAVLLKTCEHVAKDMGVQAITLTTFKDIPWNAKVYAKQGYDIFHPLTKSDSHSYLREIQAKEMHIGLNQKPRVCMIKNL